ncbi:hypothetical protein AEGHOMDF_5361 [Methylobacterium soli]|nr:hypothetical protein AEGHOMDF_5361 [Methylobacterium soli]
MNEPRVTMTRDAEHAHAETVRAMRSRLLMSAA